MARVLGGVFGRLAACLACLAAPATAQLPGANVTRSPFELTAQSLEYDSLRDLYEARGDVRLSQKATTVTADWLVFHNTSGRGVASGRVVVSDGEDTLTADFLEFNVYTFEGVVIDAELDSASSGFEMKAREIVKTGDATYRLEHGVFTTCRCPTEGRDPWQISARRMDLEFGGYGTARNSTFDILGVPIVWLPWMVYPLKTERQSGFLFPEFSFGGRNGVDVGLPFFWAVGDPLNVVLTPRWLTERGPKGDVELEYVIGQKSGGEIFASAIRDQHIDPDSVDEPFDRNRWAVLGTQDFFLPADVRLRSKFAFASDNQYPLDFRELREFRRDRFMESVAFANRGFGAGGGAGLVTEVRFADDLQSPENEDRDEYLLQRFPHVELAALPTPLGPASRLVPALDVEFTNFRPIRQAGDELPLAPTAGGAFFVGDRTFLDTGIDALPNAAERGFNPPGNPDPNRDDAPGGTEGDGLFQEGEPLGDRGQRFLLRPRLALPLRVADRVELYPEVGWNQSLWQSDAQGFAERGGFFGRFDARTTLKRRIGRTVTHLVEPRLGWALLTKESASGDPLYVPGTAVPQQRIRQLDLDSVVLDSADRVDDFHGVTLGVENRFYRRRGVGRGPQLLGDVSLSSAYRIDDRDFGLLLLDGRAYPLRRTTARFSLGFDPQDRVLSEALAQVSWSHDDGHRVDLGYRFLRDVPLFFEDFDSQNRRFSEFQQLNRVSQVNGLVRLSVTERWAVTYNVVYSFQEGFLIVNRGAVEYVSACDCWAAGVEAGWDRQRGFRFSLLYRFVGLGKERGIGRGELQGSGLLDGF